jgi:hypothetical protein
MRSPTEDPFEREDPTIVVAKARFEHGLAELIGH